MEIIESFPFSKETVMDRSSLLIGISIGNSYFKERNLERLLTWASLSERLVYIMIPDEPAICTLLALGKRKKDATRIARLKSNALENKCRNIEKRLHLNESKIIRWKDIETNMFYEETLRKMRSLYKTNEAFRETLLGMTADVLLGKGVPTPWHLEVGVEFLFKELAFIVRSDIILGEQDVSYVYHKTIPVLKDILEDRYVFRSYKGVGFITVE